MELFLALDSRVSKSNKIITKKAPPRIFSFEARVNF